VVLYLCKFLTSRKKSVSQNTNAAGCITLSLDYVFFLNHEWKLLFSRPDVPSCQLSGPTRWETVLQRYISWPWQYRSICLFM